MKTLLYISRHIAAVGVVAVLAAVVWTIVYLALLLFAIVTDGGIGSPISYPLWLVFLLISITFVGLFIFAPACAFGRIIVSIMRLPLLAAIPMVFGAGALLSYLAYDFYISLVTSHAVPPVSSLFLDYCVYLSIPLGVYWWVVDGPFAVFDGFYRWWRRRLSAQARAVTDAPR